MDGRGRNPERPSGFADRQKRPAINSVRCELHDLWGPFSSDDSQDCEPLPSSRATGQPTRHVNTGIQNPQPEYPQVSSPQARRDILSKNIQAFIFWMRMLIGAIRTLQVPSCTADQSTPPLPAAPSTRALSETARTPCQAFTKNAATRQYAHSDIEHSEPDIDRVAVRRDRPVAGSTHLERRTTPDSRGRRTPA